MYSFTLTLPEHGCLSLKHVRGSCLWINYNFSLCICWNIYRVIHKSVKHFKNSQQINYSTDHGSSYADRERNSPKFFLHISQLLNVSTFGNTADIHAIVHLVPHTYQHITSDQSHSSGDMVAKI